MAYTHSKSEVLVAKDQALTTSGDKLDWSPGYIPHYVRAVALVWTTAPAGTNDNLKVDKRPTAGSDSNRGDGDVADITLNTSRSQGDVSYQNGIDVLINPGEEIVFEVSSGSLTAGAAHVIAYVEPSWEIPGNNTSMNDDAA